jgi:Family of unknown function (DUF6502)
MASRSPPRPPVLVNEERAAIALREAAALMQPIARWLLRSGVPYGAFADLLKAVFVDAARLELEQAASKVTHSALSVLSGVHRKDVRTLAEADPVTTAPQRSISLASQVFARWLTDARYRDRAGTPRSLDRSGTRVSFESLARSLSNDVHPRTVLEELIRLGLVTLEGDKVVPSKQAFVPSRKLDELTALFAANGADHLAAAVHNLSAGASPFLEQSIFASGLSERSVEQLHAAARAIWSGAFDTLMDQGRQCIAADGDVADSFRMRFGVYYYSEPTPAESGPSRTAAPVGSTKSRAAPRQATAPAAKRAPRTRKTP